MPVDTMGLYGEVLPKAAEYGVLVFFMAVALALSMTINVLFFLRILKMMDRVIEFGNRTNDTVEKLTTEA